MTSLIDWIVSSGLPRDKAPEWIAAFANWAQVAIALFVAVLGLRQLSSIRLQLEASVKQTELLASQTEIAARQTSILAQQTRLIYEQRQAEEARERRWSTLQACERYDTDPILHESLVALNNYFLAAAGGKEGRAAKRPEAFGLDALTLKPQVATILNYLDGLAIGVYQRVYEEAMVKDHMKRIVFHHVDKLLEGGNAAVFRIDPSDYSNLVRLRRAWGDGEKKLEYEAAR